MVMNGSDFAMLSARLPARLHDQLARSAQAHDRSLSGETREAIREYVSKDPGSPSSRSSDVDGQEGGGPLPPLPSSASVKTP
jgi:plasmid stability protein